MYYKLSNTADRNQIEQLFKIPFKYPNLYHPEIVINGFTESSIPIITGEEPDKVSLGIWGILPADYNDDWSTFQNVSNTLTIDEKMLDGSSWYKTAFEHRRCLIIVTGFFTTFLQKGTIYPYYLGRPDNAPFFLAGIYNTLNDGFITASLLVGAADRYVQKFQNLTETMPVVVPENHADSWLEQKITLGGLREMMANPSPNHLKANAIAKDFFKNNITYDSMLTPLDYSGIPMDEDEL